MKAVLVREAQKLSGDVSGLRGYVSGLRGDVWGLSGDVSGLSGDVDDCGLTDEEREEGVEISALVASPTPEAA